MNDNKSEQLSALMDGEAEHHERDALIDSLCRHEDSDARGRWERYHLIRDTLHKSLPDDIQHDLSARVSAALQHEPTVLAPRRFNIHWKRFTRPMAGAAIAASVAAVSIIGLRVILPEVGVVNSVASSSPAPFVNTQDISTVAEVQNAPLQAPPLLDDNTSRLNGYLVNHSEFAAPNGIQALPPYMRLVGQGQEQE